MAAHGETCVCQLCAYHEMTAELSPLDLLALTADYPLEHPLRQAAARLTTRLALAEGKIATAVALIESDAPAWTLVGAESKLLEILRR